MEMHHVRRGSGKPLLLLHGLGGSWREWAPVLDDLAAEREVIAVDLPGFGETPPLPGKVSIETLADAVTRFLEEQDLVGVDVAGEMAALMAGVVLLTVVGWLLNRAAGVPAPVWGTKETPAKSR